MNFTSIKDWIEKLKEYSQENGVYIIVEGKNDFKTISSYGVKNIYQIKGRKFYDIVEELELAKLCIILVDLDKQGEKIAEKLGNLLKREGIPVDLNFRSYLKNFNFKEIEKLKLEDI